MSVKNGGACYTKEKEKNKNKHTHKTTTEAGLEKKKNTRLSGMPLGRENDFNEFIFRWNSY